MSRKRTWISVVLSVVVILVIAVVGVVTLPQTNPTFTCQNAKLLSVRPGPGPKVPGVAGAPRWGMPDTVPTTVRVRRSWTSLSDAEKKQYIDGVLLLKMTTVDSAFVGAERADYQSFCPSGYARNLYDYYVELHASATSSMETDDMPMEQMGHMGPQFLPWHRYLILRMEHDMQVVLGDPTFTLPYWDWDDCGPGTADGTNPCPAVFDPAFLGSAGGSGDAADITGYLTDQGYQVNIWKESSLFNIYNPESVVCGVRPLRRAVGQDTDTNRLG